MGVMGQEMIVGHQTFRGRNVNHQEGYVNMQLRKQIRKGNLLIVAKKNVQTLRSLENALSGLSEEYRQVQMLIIDDNLTRHLFRETPMLLPRPG